MRKTLVLLVAFALILAGWWAAPLGQAAEPIVIKIVNVTSQNSTKGQSWEYFKKLAEERLRGKVVVQHFHSGQLYGQAQKIAALQAGAIQFISPGTGLYTKIFPAWALWELPYLFNTPRDLRRAGDDPKIGGRLFAQAEKKGLKAFGLWLNGFRLVGTWKRPVQKLEDLQGLKLRVIPGKVYRDAFSALGANVVSIAWGEIVPALQQKVVDAIEPTASNWEAQKLHELAPHITFTNHILSNYVVTTNKKWWDGLPADIRRELAQIMKETTDYNWKLVEEVDRQAVEKMKAGGAKFFDLSPQERKRWVTRTQRVLKDYEKVVGKDVLQAVYRLSN